MANPNHKKPTHEHSNEDKEVKPDFVYDPDEDKVHKNATKQTLAEELDPMLKDNSLMDAKMKKRAKRRKRIKRIGIFALISLFVALGVGFFYFVFKAGKISTNPFNFSTKLKGEDEGRVNILILGVGDPGHAGETLADTNMVLSIDTKNNKAAFISIPRDTRVYIPGKGYAKMNYAHAAGEAEDPPNGIAVAKSTVEETLGIPIQYYVRANFSGLKQAVNAVGGIDIDVKEPLSDPEYPCETNENKSCGFKLAAGPTRMDGSLALKYARCRKGTCGDDFGRGLRQQEVLNAIKEKALSLGTLSDPKKLNDLINAFADNVKTNMSISEMQRAYNISKNISKENVYNVVFSLNDNGFLKTDPSSSDLLPAAGNFEEIKKFVKDIFTLAPIWVEDPGIVIENGTTTVGVAGKLEDKITNLGLPINVIAIQNAKTKDYTTSKIIDYSGGKVPNTIKYFEDLLGVKAEAAPEGQKAIQGQDLIIILGSDYADKITQSGTTQ